MHIINGNVIIQLKNTDEKIEVQEMELIAIIYILLLMVVGLVAFSVLQIRLAGIKIKDFWSFIQANQMLDKLYIFAKKCNQMSPQEQIIFLTEAEKVFNAFDKIPDMIWEDEYRKYSDVLETYKNIRVNRWNT